MTATIHKIEPRKSPAALVCSSCGASGTGSCDCGVAYVPAGQRAADAVAAMPGESVRAIAAETGVGKSTVHRARSKQGVPSGTPEKRTGKDGKKYPAKKKPTKKEIAAAVAQAKPEQYWEAEVAVMSGDMIAMQAAWSRRYGPAWKTFALSPETMTLIEQADDAWKAFVRDIKRRK